MKDGTDTRTRRRGDTENELATVAVSAQVPVSPRLRFSPSLVSFRLHP